MGSCFRRVMIGVAILALLLAVLGWSRMGTVEVLSDLPALEAAARNTALPAEFSIVAYNVQARPWFDETEDKFRLMPPTLEPYDIIAFQELFKDHQNLWAGFSHPVKVYDATLKHPGKIVGSGLGTISRFPLEGVVSMHYSVAGDFQNKPASKGILLTRFRVHGLPLDVYTTHMEAGSERKEPAMRARRKQGEELVAFVREHSTPDSAVIFLGDFNLRFSPPDQQNADIAAGRVPEKYDALSRNEIMDALNRALDFKDLRREVLGEPFDGVDHILYRSGAQATLTPISWQHDGPEFYAPDGAPLSDHEPIIGRFRIGKPAEAAAP